MIAIDACPRRSDTIFAGTPESSSNVAAVWRRSWTLIRGTPASRSKLRDTLLGLIGVPSGVQTIKASSNQVSAARRVSACRIRCVFNAARISAVSHTVQAPYSRVAISVKDRSPDGGIEEGRGGVRMCTSVCTEQRRMCTTVREPTVKPRLASSALPTLRGFLGLGESIGNIGKQAE